MIHLLYQLSYAATRLVSRHCSPEAAAPAVKGCAGSAGRAGARVLDAGPRPRPVS